MTDFISNTLSTRFSFNKFIRPFSKLTTSVALESTTGLSDKLDQAYSTFSHFSTPLEKNQYLHQVLDIDEALFYRFLKTHLKEILPVLYTPTVGEVVQNFHKLRSHTRGLYLSCSEQDNLENLLASYQHYPMKIAVLTDGERILGLGDQGIGGIEICIAKAMMYVICGGIEPYHLLPVYIDVGTNNQDLLNDPDYLGLKHPRLVGEAYYAWMDRVVKALRNFFPGIYLHWEDLTYDHAKGLLSRYQDQFCNFNDDMQGTGVVTLASILNALKVTGSSIGDQRIVIYGGGTAGLGIADQLCEVMQRQGCTIQEAREKIWMMGRHGLLFSGSVQLTEWQAPYARPDGERKKYGRGVSEIDLFTLVERIHPTVLIGCSGKPGAFSRSVVTEMAKYEKRPIILPLSNPTAYAEATPDELLEWTEGRALVATGSPFQPVCFQGDYRPIAQCNNALVFPGIGIGILKSGAKRLTQEMLWAACQALCELTPLDSDFPSLLPHMEALDAVTQKVAHAVAQVGDAIQDRLEES